MRADDELRWAVFHKAKDLSGHLVLMKVALCELFKSSKYIRSPGFPPTSQAVAGFKEWWKAMGMSQTNECLQSTPCPKGCVRRVGVTAITIAYEALGLTE